MAGALASVRRFRPVLPPSRRNRRVVIGNRPAVLYNAPGSRRELAPMTLRRAWFILPLLVLSRRRLRRRNSRRNRNSLPRNSRRSGSSSSRTHPGRLAHSSRVRSRPSASSRRRRNRLRPACRNSGAFATTPRKKAEPCKPLASVTPLRKRPAASSSPLPTPKPRCSNTRPTTPAGAASRKRSSPRSRSVTAGRWSCATRSARWRRKAGRRPHRISRR